MEEHLNGGLFKSNNETPSQNIKSEAITWQGPEYIYNNKPLGWTLFILIGGLLIALVTYLIIRDTISSVVIFSAALVISLYGHRKPDEITYQINSDNILINNKSYSFSQFKLFFIEKNTLNFGGISLIPHRRFSQTVSLYFPKDKEQQILDFLQNKLPIENKKPDIVDKFMLKIKF